MAYAAAQTVVCSDCSLLSSLVLPEFSDLDLIDCLALCLSHEHDTHLDGYCIMSVFNCKDSYRY
jgi:hypothetical protein